MVKKTMEVRGMKKLLLSVVLASLLILSLTGCGVFSKPELGANWQGAVTLNSSVGAVDAGTYNLTMTLTFGGIFDSNKVKEGTVKFEPADSSQRIGVEAYEFTVTDGSYDKKTKELQLNTKEKDENVILTFKGSVSGTAGSHSIGSGDVYNSSGNKVGTFNANEQ